MKEPNFLYGRERKKTHRRRRKRRKRRRRRRALHRATHSAL